MEESIRIGLNLLNLIITLWIYRSQEDLRKHTATITAIDRIDANSKHAIDEINGRLAALESDVRHLPSKDAIKAIEGNVYEKINTNNEKIIEKLSSISKEIAELSGEFKFVKQAAQDLRRNELEKR